MPAVQVIPFTSLAVERWKNGGGEVREAHVAVSSRGDVEWRLSFAEIERDGEFSLHQDVERHLLNTRRPQQGREPLLLAIDGAITSVGPGTVTTFAGESVVSAMTLNTPTRVVNLMTGRKSCTGELVVHAVRGSTICRGVSAIVVLSGSVTINAGPQLGAFDSAILNNKRAFLVGQAASIAQIRINYLPAMSLERQ